MSKFLISGLAGHHRKIAKFASHRLIQTDRLHCNAPFFLGDERRKIEILQKARRCTSVHQLGTHTRALNLAHKPRADLLKAHRQGTQRLGSPADLIR